jgi:soluble lytic murein transglycosylase-like protein
MGPVYNGNSIRFAGLTAALRLFSLARGALALVGLVAVLAVVLAAGLPAPRQTVQRLWIPLSTNWDAQASNVTGGTIVAEVADEAPLREQRALAEAIAKRYRVSQDAVHGYVAVAYRAGEQFKVDPLLVLAVMAVESRYNPVAESVLGAKGLMQVIPKFHLEKLLEHGGESALLDPDVNIQVGTQILREYLRRFGETETALQMYAGAFDEPSYSYAFKVLAERARLEQMLKQIRRSASA